MFFSVLLSLTSYSTIFYHPVLSLMLWFSPFSPSTCSNFYILGWRTWIRPRLRSCVTTLASVSWRGASWSRSQSRGPASGTSVFPPTRRSAQRASTGSCNQRWVQQPDTLLFILALDVIHSFAVVSRPHTVHAVSQVGRFLMWCNYASSSCKARLCMW